MKHTAITRALALTAAATAATALLAACGGDGSRDTNHPAAATSSRTAAPTAFNDADVMFASMMIPHHRQAVSMADRVLAHSTDPAVRQLAQRIAAAQGPEITRMTQWLTAWGRPTAAPSGMSHGDGMMSDDDMKRFDAATGADLDRLFLRMMITHHQGAVAMADTELGQGVNGPARELAQAVRTSQTAEIDEMRRMLGDAASASPSANATNATNATSGTGATGGTGGSSATGGNSATGGTDGMGDMPGMTH